MRVTFAFSRRQVCPKLARDLVAEDHPRAAAVDMTGEGDNVLITLEDGSERIMWWWRLEALVDAHQRRLRDGPPQLDLFS